MVFRQLPHTGSRRAAALTLAALAAAGCGGGGRAAAPPPVLPAGAVRYLPSTSRTLDAADLARETGVHQLAGDLSRWGFVAGEERAFQGQSRMLQTVVSRTLEFRDAAGAEAYVSFIRGHTSTYLGDFARANPLADRRRRGWLFVAAPCACHMANPLLVAVVSRGSRVTWLEVNGPDATGHTLRMLLDEAP
jgi:hypothetical protein